MSMSHIAKRLQYFDSSDFRSTTQKQSELTDPIDLSIGIPEELTPEHVKAAGIRAIQEDKTVYTPAAGLPELRVALAEKLRADNGLDYRAENITIVPGLTTGQLLVYLAILDPGDEVIVFDPYYPPYPHLASMVGAKVVAIPCLSNFQPDLDKLATSITNRTKAIVVNSPNNPSGAIYPESTLRKIAAMAAERDIIVISDEIYEHFVYDGKHFSIGSIYPNTITMNGFSKEFGMTGWRVGYIASPLEITESIIELSQYIVMSASSIAQHAAVTALDHRPRITGKYQAKRNFVHKRLTAMGYQLQGMQGAFYAFIKVPWGLTDTEFVDRATEYNLILVPGRAFSRSHDHVRLSYGIDMDTLKRGMDALEKLTDSIRRGPQHTMESAATLPRKRYRFIRNGALYE
jgi:aspartate/methionine/tyrosine aminotransferase